MILALFLACASPPPPIDDPPMPARAQPDGCPVPGEPKVRGHLADRALDEVSGVVYSPRHGVFWVHNDSGGDPRVYAVGPDGSDRGGFDLRGADANDWEDMARLPGDPTDHLVLADIGDNREKRATVQLYRIPEPTPGTSGPVEAERMEVRYPDGPHNAEVLLADPRDGALYVLTKSDDGQSVLFALGPWKTGQVTAEAVATYRFPAGYSAAKATGGDVSDDGAWLAIRTYTTIWLFPVDGALQAALAKEPCEARPPQEEQGEAVTFVPGGLVTISEGKGSAVHFLPWEPAKP
ncbi:MAG: hypothetical protein H6737_31355 [Alphaproteobacteria bacterium]|nr:hypothetical protein [Alphaproteobacteria bacterium]